MRNGWTGGQYSVFRVLFGAYLFVHFASLVPWGVEVFSSAGMVADPRASPLVGLFPNVLGWLDSPSFVIGLLGASATVSIAFAAGVHDRAAALWLWYVLACLFGRNPMIQNPSLPYVGWILLAHACLPSAPYGSWAARGRLDPGGRWHFPRALFLAAWAVLALSYSYSGWTKTFSESWLDGRMLGFVLENPLARDGVPRDLFLALPAWIAGGVTHAILGIELLFVAFALFRRLRIGAWAAMVVVQLGFALLLDFADLTCAMLLVHLFTFDPAWVRGASPAAVERVFYDGRCGMCHGVVRFILAEDTTARFRLSPLQGATFARTVPAQIRAALPDSFIVVGDDGAVLSRSDAIVHVLRRLGGLWRVAGALLRAVPRSWRDAAYDAIGSRRHLAASTPAALCPLTPPHLRDRFLA